MAKIIGKHRLLPVSSWAATTVTLEGLTATGVKAVMRRVGDSAEFRITGLQASSSGTSAAIVLPAGLALAITADNNSARGNLVGLYFKTDEGAPTVLFGSSRGGVIFHDGSTTTKVFLARNTGAASALEKTAGNATGLGDAQGFTLEFTVQISGWLATDIIS